MDTPVLALTSGPQVGYEQIYAGLSDLREIFHRVGRLDDSNAKLDEVAKLFATYVAFRKGQVDRFPHGSSSSIIADLQSAFAQASSLPAYQDEKGESIFGPSPALVLREGDEEIACHLVQTIRSCVDIALQMKADARPFDILNEAFGHFVRDNFRGNVEDAQYMTPPEVVDLMVGMAVHELEGLRHIDALTVVDPTCGVGSFLTAFYHQVRRNGHLNACSLRLVGQDKVDRMVRLSKLNLEFFNSCEHAIYAGSSLEDGGSLDHLNGKVDLVLTNPPFGARFDATYISKKCKENAPFFSQMRSSAPIDSELLFVDRSMALLKEGGILLIVVPDGVVSARGAAALLRNHLSHEGILRAVIELPPTAFAQAGTRTKTSILMIRKGRNCQPTKSFLAIASDLGFQVSSRKGVNIKVMSGTNELPAILGAYMESTSASVGPAILSDVPSCVAVEEAEVVRMGWTPRHYSADRFQALSMLEGLNEYRLVSLREVVSFHGKSNSAAWRDGAAFISVLHVLGEGFVDVGAALAYAPKTAGLLAHVGDVLISRINPRIPRICVVPDLGVPTLCSGEFEVMRCREEVDPYLLAYLLQTSLVQRQIQNLTSGTSASHNRIRTAELESVLIPIPASGSATEKHLSELAAAYKVANITMVQSALELARLRAAEGELFHVTN